MEIVCQSCNATYIVNDDRMPDRTRVTKCTRCHSPITVIGKHEMEQSISSRNALIPSKQNNSALAIPVQENTKVCDFCGEKVLAVAKKCKHCGEILDVVLRAAADARTVAQPNVFMNAGGGAATQIPKHSFPHVWHFLGTVITGGLWAIIWLLHYISRDRNYYY